MDICIDETKGIECYVDTELYGNYHKDRTEDSTPLLSRTWFAIFYMNYPVIWISKLQECISQSTIEVEYVALSHSIKELIKFTGLAEELNVIFDTDKIKPCAHNFALCLIRNPPGLR